MGENDTASLQAFILILIFSFSMALLIVGIIMRKTRIWDRDKKNKKSKNQSPSATAGKLMIICGAILAMVSLMFILATATGLI